MDMEERKQLDSETPIVSSVIITNIYNQLCEYAGRKVSIATDDPRIQKLLPFLFERVYFGTKFTSSDGEPVTTLQTVTGPWTTEALVRRPITKITRTFIVSLPPDLGSLDTVLAAFPLTEEKEELEAYQQLGLDADTIAALQAVEMAPFSFPDIKVLS